MKSLRISWVAAVLIIAACNNNAPKTSETKKPNIKEANITIDQAGTPMDCFVAYNSNSDQKRPGILVVPEWWGMNDYVKMRARKLAELGYIAMTVDVYGNGKIADNPDSAGKFASVFYKAPQLAKARLDAAIAKLKTYSQTDTSKMAAIGYCFGGGVVLNSARLGEDLKGVVSFHGNLIGTPANKDLLKSKILVCYGLDDQFVKKAEADEFKHQMDSIGADYTFKEYPGATHAFTNPDATALGKKFNLPIAYNAAADTASWNDMQDFFNRIFK
jgi:dienelactone hydrolase